MAWNTLDDLDLAGKTVLTRVDINVPMENGRVTDATRIEKIIPTIRDIRAKGGRAVLLAHFGRPKGRPVPEMSLAQLTPALEAALGHEVIFIETPSRAAIEATPTDAVILVENTRFSRWRRQTIRKWRNSLQGLVTFTAMTLFQRHIGRMPRPKVSRICCPLARAA